jgi:hypothetical protein
MRSTAQISRPLALEALEDRLVLSQALPPAVSPSDNPPASLSQSAASKIPPESPPGAVEKDDPSEYASSRAPAAPSQGYTDPQSFSLSMNGAANSPLNPSNAAALFYSAIVAQLTEARLEALRQSHTGEVFQDRQLAASLVAGAADRALAAGEAALAVALARAAAATVPLAIPVSRHVEVAGQAWLVAAPAGPMSQGAEAHEEEPGELDPPAIPTPAPLASTGFLAAGQLPVSWATLEASAGQFLAHLEDLGRDLAGSWVMSSLALWLAILATPPLILEIVRDRRTPAHALPPGPPRSELR